MKRVIAILIGCAGLLSSSGCDEDDPLAPAAYDFAPILAQFANGVVIPTYADLETKAAALQDAVIALRSAPDPTTLAVARAAWVATRSPWEKSEGFLFGPVDFNGFDPALDSWPVSQIDLDAVLASSDVLTTEYVRALDNTLKGFHTIEYLLYGPGGTKTAGSFTAREFDYLVAATGLLHESAHALHTSWIPSGDNYGAAFSTAGAGSAVYVSQEAALQDILNGMIGICDEVANGKINEPFANMDPQLEESQFSDNSLVDFQDNLRSVRNGYMGAYGADGIGLDSYVAGRDAALAARLQAEIDAAIAAIGAIPFPFRTAIGLHPEAITAAQTAINRVQQTLQQDVLPLVSGA